MVAHPTAAFLADVLTTAVLSLLGETITKVPVQSRLEHC